MTKDKETLIALTSDDALLFVQFQRHHELIAYMVGYLDSMGTDTLRNSQVVLDIGPHGTISHASVTKHFRR